MSDNKPKSSQPPGDGANPDSKPAADPKPAPAPEPRPTKVANPDIVQGSYGKSTDFAPEPPNPKET